MRHAERKAIPQGELGHALKITQEGIDKTLSLGVHFENRLIKIYSSPVRRCLETAKHLKSIAKYPIVKKNKMLGDPGVFVENPEIASKVFFQFEPIEIATALLNKKSPIPGFCLSVKGAVKKLLSHLFELSVEKGVYLFITHDSILGVVNGFLFPHEKLTEVWPDFLDAVFLYQKEGLLYAVFRGERKIIDYNNL